MLLPEIQVTVLGDCYEYETTLAKLCQGKVGVIDFWHTRCVRCPAALDKFNVESALLSEDNVVFVACALSLGEGNKEDVHDLALEEWRNIRHVFVDESVKEAAKAAFGYDAVPYYAVFDKTGTVVAKGANVNYVDEIKKLLAEEEEEDF